MKEIIFFNEAQESEHYRVTDQPTLASLKEKLSDQSLQEYLDLHERALKNDAGLIEAIEAFRKWEPHLPEIYNLLTFAYVRKNKIKEAEQLIRETYQKFPYYLFGKINFADQCLRKKQLQRIPEIFPHFSLQALYPDKKHYHATEFRGFMIVMGFYHLALKNRERTQEYLRCAKEADPTHPSIYLLEKRLTSRSFFLRLLSKIRRWVRR